MSVTWRLPKHDERVTIRWPGGEHDFVILVSSIELIGPGEWVLLTGLVVEPEGVQHRWTRSFYVRLVDDEWTLHPKLL